MTTHNKPFARPAWRLLALAAATTIAVTGCGGGGGSTDDDDQGVTGLVPAAPTPGATLFSDAKVLRPMKAGARWEYAGTADGAAYSNVVTQTSAAVGVTESGTNTLNMGSASVNVAQVNGNIVQVDPVDFDGDGVPDISNLIELRSPVRQNEQFVVIDLRLPNALPDLDGDGRGEHLDIAVYNRVIGTEDVVLAGLPTQRAVRVERTGLSRVVMSKDGQKLPTVTAIATTWYAPSVGIVRRHFDRPTDDNTGRQIIDELATGWSGF